MKLTYQEAKKVVEFYYANDNSPTQAARCFNNWAHGNNSMTVIIKKNVIDVIKRFERDTAFDKITRRRPSLLKNEDVVFDVLGTLGKQPGKSIRTCAEENQLSVSVTHRIARKVLKLQPYRLTLTQSLSEYDKIVRIQACHHLLEVLTDEKLIVYSDEASFRLDGHVNRWNYRVWDYERPDEFYMQQKQGSSHVTVWAALTRKHLFGPYFFPATVTGDSYRAVLSEFFLPELLASHSTGMEHIWFQQDGAPAHYATETKHFLSEIFQGRIVSRGFLHEWPPRSPDLTPCDFYLWGVIKDIAFRFVLPVPFLLAVNPDLLIYMRYKAFRLHSLLL
jgi:hypothetical protein